MNRDVSGTGDVWKYDLILLKFIGQDNFAIIYEHDIYVEEC